MMVNMHCEGIFASLRNTDSLERQRASQIRRAIQESKAIRRSARDKPFQNAPSYEKLVGDLPCFYSRRINWQHRLIYRVDEEHQIVYVDSMWSHYER